ncbi:MAG: HlyD family efflux transporter periplasmic adaptor subunit [Myxococcota bacterium]|nr:HlyD family efflux transporter periplasmic adaptor subunit [Myxococcota bacterium]
MPSPLRAWLDLQCQMVAGAEAGLVVLGSSEHAASAEVARWPAQAAGSARLSAVVAETLEQGRLVVQTGGGPDGLPASQLAVPIVQAERVVGAFGVSVRGLPAAETKALAGLLGFGVRGLALLLEAHAGQDELGFRLSLAGSVLDHEHLAEAGHALAGELARALGCERVAVGLRRGAHTRVVALSSTLRFSEEGEGVRELPAAMEEALEQDTVIALPAPPEAPADARPAHELFLRGSGAGSVCTVPLASRGRAVGAVTFQWGEPGCVDEERGARLREAGILCGPLLELMGRAQAGSLERLRDSLERFRARHFGDDRALARGALGAAALLLLLLAIVPAPYRISAPATLEGRVQRALVAGVSGYIAEAHARAGDVVRAGDLLARLDDRDLRLERRKRASQKAQLEKEYREALASRDRTQVSILRAQIERAAAELGLVEEQIGRTDIVAPFDGVVLRGDLDRALGSPVERGEVLFEIAPLDGYRTIVEVDGRDIADAEVGQTGRLALSALPGRRLPLVIERITPVSTTRDGRSYFRVEAALEAAGEDLRPGMEGIAKIDAGRRRLLWIWTHETLDWLRLATWSLLP